MCTDLPSVTTFWPEVKGNLTLVKWKHAVNNKTLLDEALKSEVHMIEADVSLDKNKLVPIMAHPPEDTSNLTLEAFIKTVNQTNSKKGIKLDFKTIAAFNHSVRLLRNNTELINFPVWLNADIIKGPEADQNTLVNATEFLTTASDVLPGSTLSLGWTTKTNALSKNSSTGYSKENIEVMLNILKEKVPNSNQSVTYAVRAGLLINTNTELVNHLLKSSSQASTLTIWSKEDDSVDAEKLSKLIMDIGVDKVYIDVPANLEKQLQLNSSGNIRTSSLSIMGSILLTFLGSRILYK